eukprot:gnl/Dysnectes_brevis/708_a781_3116.p1 GENE.gnl/Dysnectes_brevis/708_a781_3116~~gnl/Dysnectes_brevis/708_a781_3116.p1  ORF type:complete len:534 (+),score=291.26 gnl/Dysnectes_brevis/708_a781_3116:841-2442(+)
MSLVKSLTKTIAFQSLVPTLARSYVSKGTKWSPELEPSPLILPDPLDIVDGAVITKMLEETKQEAKDVGRVRAILDKALDRALLKHVSPCELKEEFVQGLSLREVATLLNCDFKAQPELEQMLFDTALQIKERIYGNRVVLFAPLYVANYCVNSCLYCGFNAGSELGRQHLTLEEVHQEVQAIESQGHKRILMLCGESPRYTFDDFLDAIKVAADTKLPPHGEIRRINVECPVLSLSDLKRLKETDAVGTYTVFQESYNRASYRKVHVAGPKADQDYRLTAMDRSMRAGIDDVGIGALFGLHDFRFEVMGLVMHAAHLDRTYGVGPHTISIPRLKPAADAPVSVNIPAQVDDDDFRKLVAILRCAVPYTGMILSTREGVELRRDLLQLGISQLSAGSRTDPGAYSKGEKGQAEAGKNTDGQFELADHRELDEVIADLLETGFMPSQCTACYSLGRTGETFMGWAKNGSIQHCCLPNAMMTMKEYSDDYASPSTRALAERAIADSFEKIGSSRREQETREMIDRIAAGERGLKF